MKNEFFKDTRLLESLDYIDSDLIGEVAGKLRVDGAAEKAGKATITKSPFRAWRQAAAIVACALLMGALIPAISFITATLTSPSVDGGAANGGESDRLESLPEETEQVTSAEVIEGYDGSQGLEYAISDDGTSAYFYGYGDCTDTDIVIASTYNGLPVTRMISASYSKASGGDHIRSITVSDSVEVIGAGVFDRCTNLESIHLGANVNKFSFLAFDIPQGNNITSLTVSPENTHYMSRGNCIIEIETKTLVAGCRTSVIPDDGSVEIIGHMALSGISGITSLVIPEGVKAIKMSAFCFCSDLVSLTLPKSLETMEEFAFEYCQNLEYVDLNGFTELPDGVFISNRKLKEIKGLEYVTVIGEAAFFQCDSLEDILLGSCLTSVGNNAFQGNNSLTTIYFAGTASQWRRIDKGESWYKFTPLENIICSDRSVKPEA